MLKVGINGFGRIGRAIFRINMIDKAFKVVAINDINPDINNIAYTLNYDTLHGSLENKFSTEKDYIYNNEMSVRILHEKYIDKVDWKSEEVDIVIDASGVYDNVLRAGNIIKSQKVKKIIITHSPDPVDFTMILGVNENKLDINDHQIISSSICDATAIAPVFKIIQDNVGIECGTVTTLHPWLNYQNVMDGPASSWSAPGTIYHHYALGRSSIGNMIPKPTSAITATCKVLDDIKEDMIGSFSYRTPTAIVGSADITLTLRNKVSKEEIINIFKDIENKQRWNIIHNNFEPLVSLDFTKSKFSAVVDHRWTDVINGNMLKLVLWYDNEWGYSRRVIDQIKYIAAKMEE